MLIKEALQVFGLSDAKDMTEMTMRKLFLKLSKSNHPDMGGDTLRMQMIVDAWETMQAAYKKDSKWCDWSAASAAADYDVVAMFRDILAKVQHLDGLDLEINGSWLWVGGKTKQHAPTLKENGFRFSRKKCQWSWHPVSENDTGKRKWHGKTKSHDAIRQRYGSQKVNTIRQPAVQ